MDQIAEEDSNSDSSLEQDYFDEEEEENSEKNQTRPDAEEDDEKEETKQPAPASFASLNDNIDRNGTNYAGKVLAGATGGETSEFYYRVGVIDFLTRHNAMKTMETNLKSAFYNVSKDSISAQKPDDYQRRFMDYFRDKLQS